MDRRQISYSRNQQQDIADDRSGQIVRKPQWSALLKLLAERLDEAAIAIREADREMTLEGHNSYYRAVFDKVREESASRDDIPNAIMENPTQELALTFYGKWKNPVCLGCVDFDDTNDVIHVEIHAKEGEPDGVTKDDLICCIFEVVFQGLHVYSQSNKETSIIPSSFDWMDTTTLCNLVDSILYIGYEPVTKAPRIREEKDGLEGEDNCDERYEVTWKPDALSPGALAYQGYDEDYAKKLMMVKGWGQEGWDLHATF